MTQTFILSVMTNEALHALIEELGKKQNPTEEDVSLARAIRDELADRVVKTMCLLMDEEMMI